MKLTIISLSIVILLSGCATGSAMREKITGKQFDEPVVEQNVYLNKDSNKLVPPEGGPIHVAVYGFTDKTGQRKSMPNIASLSSAVTQGADAYLIKALQDVGDARWFKVLERVGLDNLIKERQMIRQMRELYQGKDAKPLPPMMFAGMIFEGGIIGYDSNTLTGGSGVRLLGIGASTQYQSDTVTINLRTVSVSTGEVLTSVTVTKTVLSYMDKFGVLKFIDSGTTSVEGEIGGSINESINKATTLAIQAAVVDTIREGARKGHWNFKKEKTNELVQPQTSQTPERAPEPQPAAQTEPSNAEGNGKGQRVEPKPEVKREQEELTKTPIPTPPIDKVEVKETVTTNIQYLKEDSYVYKDQNEKSQRTWLLKKGQEFSSTNANAGWVAVTTKDGKKGFVREEVLTSNKP
jgi:curli production assembly/transport component CsgG